MAHRPRGNVTLTGYSSRPEPLSDFLTEMRTIRESKVIIDSESEEMDFSETEDGSVEWLKKAGFGTFVKIMLDDNSASQEDEESIDFRTQTSVLPQAHARAIHKRMHTLRTTIRSRHGREPRKGSSNLATPETKTVFNSKESSIDSQVKNADVQLVSVEKRSSIPCLNSSFPNPRKITTTTPSPSLDNITTVVARDDNKPNSPPITTPSHTSLERQKSSSCDSSPVSSRKLFPSPPNSLSFNSPKRRSNGVLSDRGSSSLSLMSTDDTSPTSDMKLSFSHQFSQITEHELPVISLNNDPLGITEIGDLSQADLEKVRCLAHIELSVTFEEKGIPLRSLRPKKLSKTNDDQLFGVPLSTMLSNDQKRNSRASIPLLFKEMVEYLETNGLSEEGILRVSGSKQRAKLIQDEMEASYNGGSFSFEGKKPSDIASLLKQFIRDLPVPLLTMENLPAFASIPDIIDFNDQLKTLNLLVLMLPTLHQRVLKRLLVFCEHIHMNKEITKMDIANISMVLAPNLFLYLPSSKLSCDDVALASKTSRVVMLLIKYHLILWTVPAGMLKQVRFLYETELKKVNQRNIKQALQKMTPTHDSQVLVPQSQETSKCVIRVFTPLFTSRSKAVNIQENPTAGMAVAKLRKRAQYDFVAIKRMSTGSLGDLSPTDDSCEEEGEMNVEEQFLYESGGNIGERRLHDNTNMLAVFAVNPHASWTLKPRNYRENSQSND